METIWKNKLQEYCQKNALKLPTYEEHDLGLAALPTRWHSYCTLTVGGETHKTHSETPSTSKREAEQKAARNMYLKITNASDLMENLSIRSPPATPTPYPTTPSSTPTSPSQPTQTYAQTPTQNSMRGPVSVSSPYSYASTTSSTSQTSPSHPYTPDPKTVVVTMTPQSASLAQKLPLKTSNPPPPSTTIPVSTSKISSRGASRSRLQKALAEEGLQEPIFVYQCIVYLPDGTSYRSDEFADPKRAEDEAAQRAFEAFVST